VKAKVKVKVIEASLARLQRQLYAEPYASQPTSGDFSSSSGQPRVQSGSRRVGSVYEDECRLSTGGGGRTTQTIPNVV
jgi:hypothetical protein